LYLNKEKARKKLTKADARKLLKYIKNGLIENNIKTRKDILFYLLRSYDILVKKTKC
jgi:hypothetical protein